MAPCIAHDFAVPFAHKGEIVILVLLSDEKRQELARTSSSAIRDEDTFGENENFSQNFSFVL